MNVGRKSINPRDRIARQVHTHQLGSAGLRVRHCEHLGLIGAGSACVEHPKGIIWSDIQSLDAIKSAVGAAAKGYPIDSCRKASRRTICGQIRVWDFGRRIRDFSKGVRLQVSAERQIAFHSFNVRSFLEYSIQRSYPALILPVLWAIGRNSNGLLQQLDRIDRCRRGHWRSSNSDM